MLPEIAVVSATVAFTYHHFVYPALLARLVGSKGISQSPCPLADPDLPAITLIVPCHNEGEIIAEKIRNIAELDYPRQKLTVVIACDGCTDDTLEIARATASEVANRVTIDVVEYSINIGKVAVLNDRIAAANSAIVALSDASAVFPPDSLRRAAAHFAEPEVGVVCPTYRLRQAGSEGERAYWLQQVRVKVAEGCLGAPMGAHGAFYLFRRKLWSRLPDDTINDDFVLPMGIVAAGYRAIYDDRIVALELETTRPDQEFRRRIRIGAGNVQQVLRSARLANPARPGVAFVFLSGKALRPLISPLAVLGLAGALVGAAQGKLFFTILSFIALMMLGLATFACARRSKALPRSLVWLGYLVEGHTASLIGAVRYIFGYEAQPWIRSNIRAAYAAEEVYVPPPVATSKRMLDVAIALVALAVLAVLFVPIALAIKLTSKGPIFYRQLRVGRATALATHVFYLIKFRTMRIDAEAGTGAVWATKNDPRITPVGLFLRKTRLDELPQAINVLKGEMSIVGPRPERPAFFAKLEDAIPFYIERTYGLRPGITGLAQVNQAYDELIEDVRNKVLYDHAYAAHLTRWRDWLRADFGIILKTAMVMGLGKGQ